MLPSIHDKNTKSIPTDQTLQITVILVIAILILAQTMLIYVILSRDSEPTVLARPEACDNFEMKTPTERAKCLPVDYTHINMIET